MLYDWLVINYGNPASFQVGILLTNLIILIVEFDGNWILCSVIILLSLFFFAAVVRMFQLQELALFYKFQWISSAGLACASMADVLIAVSLCWYLMKTRTGLQTKTDSIVTRLILYAINTGLLTSVVVLMDMICFLTMPDNLIHLSFNIMVGKLYSNSLLATLNFRNSVRKRNKDGITTFSFSNRIHVHEETIITRDGVSVSVPASEFRPMDIPAPDQATIDTDDTDPSVQDEKVGNRGFHFDSSV
ncbi:hypothetical protein FB45DRAFT_942621 [Roridomyces roridus]|uniref:DUF6534 domain-containing protein n=1 Tax=Roridomyces roridus TaxID=1738132 RepID=A0AAD7B4N1_9AGAR|nr:hypothetical protein FB45DRAFT_942621 [Roridomyces roridus]